MNEQYTQCALVVGAGGGIGRALVVAFSSDPTISHVFAVSSRSVPADPRTTSDNVTWLPCDYSENSIEQLVKDLTTLNITLTRVCICNGILHGENLMPEKRLEYVKPDSLRTLFSINAILPLVWLKSLQSLCQSDVKCCLAVLSARVGSISDNRLGGWYGYRASKAALNMFLKTAASEYRVRNKNVKLIAFHPGTTDTWLSKPFQSRVAPEKLFSPEFVASRLLGLMKTAEPDGELVFLDWDGKNVEW